jgi:hypothetical protein
MTARTYLLFGAAALIALSSVASVRAADSAQSVAPDADMQALVDAVRANRKALVAVNLGLNAEEGARFWPLFDRYQAEIDAVGDRVVAIIADYAAHFHDLSNEKALQLITDYLAAEAERVKVRQTYLGEFAKILPGRTVARFYQIENKMDAVLRYDMAAAIPVIDDGGGSAGQ